MAGTETIAISLRFFGALSESVSGEILTRELPEGRTLGDLRRALVQEHPDEPRLAICMIAVNAEYRDEATPLRDGDEVAMIPPVSGG